MKTYQVTLPDEIAAFVERVLADKTWDSADHLIAYALMQTEAELKGEATTEAVRNAVRVGIEQADRGELTDGPAVLKRLRDKLEAARKQPT